MATVTCPECGLENLANRKKCRVCRTSLTATATSWHVTPPPEVISSLPRERGAAERPAACSCGTPLSADAVVCETCGTPVGPVPTAGGTARPSATEASATEYVLAFPWGEERAAGPEPLGLGRAPEFSPFADRLASYPTVSGRHARLDQGSSGFVVVHLSLTNGTWVNGQAVERDVPHPLVLGDEVHLSAACSMVVVG